MYPDLSYLFHDLLGTPPDNWTSIFKTFGLLLVLAVLSAAFILYRELKRKAKAGTFKAAKVKRVTGEPPRAANIIGGAIWGFLLGYKGVYAIQHFETLQRDADEVLLSADGNWFAGIALAAILAGVRYWQDKRQQLPKPKVSTRKVYPHDRIGEITIIAAVCGVAGAKLFAVIEDIPALLADPLSVLFSGSGLAIYGGLIGGFIGVALYLRSKDIPIVPVLDAVAPALIIAYGVGRMGCHFSGDGDWGIVNTMPPPSWWFLPDWVWAYDYPHNVLRQGEQIFGCEWKYCKRLAKPVYPTPIYETTMAFGIGGILFALRRPLAAFPGLLFCVYLVFNGVERFFIEKVRVNQEYETFMGGSLTQAQFIALILIFIGLVAGTWIWWHHRKNSQTAKP